MKHLLFFLLAFPFLASAQILEKQFVATVQYNGFTQINDSLYRGDLIEFRDVLIEGYQPSGVDSGFICLDGTGRAYRVEVVNSFDYSSLNVDLIELDDYDEIPIGVGIVAERYGSTYQIPNGLVNSIGISSVLQAKILNHNTKIAATTVQPPDTLYLKEASGITAISDGDTIDVSPYLFKSDTTSMLARYIERGDTNSMLTNYPTKAEVAANPTTIAIRQIPVSNGSNLVGYSGFTWNDALKRLTLGGSEINGYGFLTYSQSSPSSYIGMQADPSNAVIYSNGDRLYLGSRSVPTTITVYGALVGLNNASPTYTLDVNSTDAIRIPRGTDVQRPASATGLLRYTTTGLGYEGNDGSGWFSLLQSSLTGGKGTATRVPFFDANGRTADSGNLTFTNSESRLNIGGTNSWIRLDGSTMKIQNNNGSGVSGFYNFNTGLLVASNNSITFAVPPVFTYGQVLGGFNSSLFNVQLSLSGTLGVSNQSNVFSVRPTGTVTLSSNSILNFLNVDATAVTASGSGKKVAANFRGGGVVIGNSSDPVEEFRVIGDGWFEDSLRLSQTALASKILQTDASGWVKPLTLSGMDYTGGTLRANSIYNLLPIGDVTVSQTTPDTFKLGVDGTFDVLGEDRKETKYGGIDPLFGQGTVGATMTIGREGYWAEKGTGTDSIQTPLNLFGGNVFRGDGHGMELALGGFRSGSLGTGKNYVGYAGLQWFTDYFNSSRAYLRLKDSDNSGNFYYTNFRRGSVVAVSLAKYNMAYDLNQYDSPGIPSNSIIAENFLSVGGSLYPTKTFQVFNSLGADRASIDSSGVMRLNTYGAGNREATDISKTQSAYIAGFATDGTLLDHPISSIPSVYNNLPSVDVTINANLNQLTINELDAFWLTGGASTELYIDSTEFSVANPDIGFGNATTSMSLDESTGEVNIQGNTEVVIEGLVRAKQEGYNTITSTVSPQTLSNLYPDNLINQGSTQASFTFQLPASPVDGQISKATFANAVTVLTIDGNGTTVLGTLPTTANAGQQIVFKNYAGLGWIRQL